MGTVTHFLLVSSGVISVLGLLQLTITLRGTALWPRTGGLKEEMERAFPRITEETTMWKAWLGFNISHSMGALLFGVVYGYIAVNMPEVFASSLLLQFAGLSFLAGYCVLGYFFWFSRPFRAILLATAAYGISIYGAYV